MNSIDGITFVNMVENGYRDLKNHYEKINDLNVFPVPDGDTGTNIAATLTSGVEAMEKANKDSLGDVANKLATGMLLGARGNSGVILSQFFSGIADALSDLTSANLTQFASALHSGTLKAYSAVVQPVEGTILTVARESSDYVLANISQINDFETFFSILLKQMDLSLQRTPELLPVLKEAGVIDSGGAGLLYIVEGMCKEITGEEVADVSFNGPSNGVSTNEQASFDENSVLTYGYCTEFILQLTNSKHGPSMFSLKRLINYFSRIGNSLVAIRQGNLVKVHVHTLTPAKVIDYAQKYGEFVTFKMENMSIQHNEVVLKEEKKKKASPKNVKRVPVAIAAVSPSKPISELFQELGVSQIISGGQTMNPSTKDFVDAFSKINADTIIVFPNNSNVILTAAQAAKIYADAKVLVIPTKSIVEAYSALSMADFANQSLEQNLKIMKRSMANLTSASVCPAVRDSKNNGLDIKLGDFIGFMNGKVVADSKEIIDCVIKTLNQIKNIEDKEVLTVFYGKDVKEEEKTNLEEKVKASFPMIEIVEIEGGQDIFPFIFAVE